MRIAGLDVIDRDQGRIWRRVRRAEAIMSCGMAGRRRVMRRPPWNSSWAAYGTGIDIWSPEDGPDAETSRPSRLKATFADKN